jgi:hypothetical protein
MLRTVLILLAPALVAAQNFETKLGTETAEFVGGIQHQHDSGPTDPVYAGKLLAGLSHCVSLYGEYSYSRLRSSTLYPGPTILARTSLSDIGGGVEFHKSGSRIQPYALAGVGTVRDSSKLDIGGDSRVSSVFHFAYSLGAGARLFVSRHFGFLAEVKTVDPMDAPRFERYGVGVFWQQQHAK